MHTGLSSGAILETKSAAVDKVIKKAEIALHAGILNQESSSGRDSSIRQSRDSDSIKSEKGDKSAKKRESGSTVEEIITEGKADASESATQRDPSSIMLTAHQVGLEPIE